ncbi:MAG: hypothetical protein R3B93_21955 [Bacteroidia bacterium]
MDLLSMRALLPIEKRNGRGTLTYADGSRYEGYWKDNEEHGQGKMYWSSQDKTYDGNWVNGVREGQGTSVYGDKASFTLSESDSSSAFGRIMPGKKVRSRMPTAQNIQEILVIINDTVRERSMIREGM